MFSFVMFHHLYEIVLQEPCNRIFTGVYIELVEFRLAYLE